MFQYSEQRLEKDIRLNLWRNIQWKIVHRKKKKKVDFDFMSTQKTEKSNPDRSAVVLESIKADPA